MEPKAVTPLSPSSTSAEARARAVERLCDGFSHDTRNPLNAVVIHLEVLADRLRRENAGSVPYGLEKNLRAIRDQVNRLDEMVRRFVEIAAPHRQHEPEFDLGQLVQSVVEQCTHQARLARSELRAEPGPQVRLGGSASELAVGLVLFLLAQLSAGARRLSIRTDTDGSHALLVVDGTVEGAGHDELQRAAATFGGVVSGGTTHVEVSLALARGEPSLRVVTDGSSGGRP